MEYLHIHKQEDLLPRAWRSTFLRPGLVLKHSTWPGPCLCIGKQNSMALFWPLKQDKNGKTTVFSLEPITDASHLRAAPLLFFKDWTTYPAACPSPVRLWIEGKYHFPAGWPNVLLMQTDKTCQFLSFIAKNAFFDAGLDMVDRILKHEFGLNVDSDSEAEKLFAAIKAALQCTDSTAADIMELRVKSSLSKEEREMLLTAVDENVLEDRASASL